MRGYEMTSIRFGKSFNPSPTYVRRYASRQSHFSTTDPSTMVPAPLITGTVIYAIIGAALCALTFGALVTGKLSKDNAA